MFDIQNADTVGIFGAYKTLTLKTNRTEIHSVWMQDLADTVAFDITDDVSFSGGCLRIPGEWIKKIGTSAQPIDDTSEAGVLLKMI